MIAQAITGSSFDAMRRLEQQEIARRQPGLFWRNSYAAGHARGHRFVNRGAVRGGRELLSADERALIARVFADAIALLGYQELAAALG
jgi:hypothetical protein